MSRRRRRMTGDVPWILREYGGAPMWLILGAVVFLAGVVLVWATALG